MINVAPALMFSIVLQVTTYFGLGQATWAWKGRGFGPMGVISQPILKCGRMESQTTARTARIVRTRAKTTTGWTTLAVVAIVPSYVRFRNSSNTTITRFSAAAATAVATNHHHHHEHPLAPEPHETTRQMHSRIFLPIKLFLGNFLF